MLYKGSEKQEGVKGSVQIVISYKGSIYKHFGYTPHAESLISRAAQGKASDPTIYRFSGKELDIETGLYYYGSRYLDPRTSRWVSADPAMYQGDYVPGAPVNEEARKRNRNLPGQGGVFNYVNLHVYHYAGNNPIRYMDPDGRTGSFPDESVEQNAQWEKAHGVDVTFTLKRNYESYKTTGGRNKDLRDGDILTFTNNKTGDSFSIPVSSVPNMNAGNLGDAVALGDVYLTLGPELKNDSNYAPDVFTISGGKTISGETINRGGLVPSSDEPYRGHDSPGSASMGCFTGSSTDSGGPIKIAVDTLKSWGVKYGGAMKGSLLDNAGRR